MIYINGRGVSPFATILVIALFVILGVLLLPVIGGLLLAFLIFVLCLALYGIYWRWRHGDPIKHMQEELAARMRQEQQREEPFEEPAKEKRANQTRVGVKRVTEVEDAVIVEEIDPKR